MYENVSTEATQALRARVALLGDDVGRFDARGVPDVELVGLLGELEVLKCRVEAAQVVATAALDSSQCAAQAAAGVPADRQGLGVGLQVALARRESHHRGERHLGLARVLTRELPCTLGALRSGLVSEWRATVVARETACLSREHRAEVDQELGDLGASTWSRWGERELVGELRRRAYRLDPASVVARRRHAESERSVSLRPAPDCMTYLTALLPVVTGVGVFAELTRVADSARAAGDERGRGQVMADTLATRLLGQPDGGLPRVPVTVNVVVSDEVLLGQGPSPPTATTTRLWSRGTGWCPRASPVSWPAPVWTPLCSCAGCTRTPPPGGWCRWTPGPGASHRRWPSSSACVTGSAAPPGATHRSGTSTTSAPTPTAARRRRKTPKACAKPATTPKQPPAGTPRQ